MAFSGGVFSRLYNWVNDRDANIKITASRMDAEMDGFATGLSTALLKDGTQTVTANIPMSTYKFTGVGDGSARNEYLAIGQLQDGEANWVDGGGTADAITATYSPSITALVDGMLCFVRATAANATTTPTFSPNGLTARNIVKSGGTALIAGDIIGDGHELVLRYDLSNTRWELLNPGLGAGSSAVATLTGTETLTNKTFDNITVQGDIIHDLDTDNQIAFTTDTQDFQTGGSSRMDINDSGVRMGGANARVTTILDEDAMGSDSATSLATQQSIKKYVDDQVSGAAADVLHYQEQLASGSNSPSYTSGSWNTVPVNTEVTDTGSHGSVASDQITLASGTYELYASAYVWQQDGTAARLRFYNATDTANLVNGLNCETYTPQADYGGPQHLSIFGYFTLGASKACELQVYPNGASSMMGGVSSGDSEIYSTIFLRKVA